MFTSFTPGRPSFLHFNMGSWIQVVMPKKTRPKRDVKKREPAVVGASPGNYEEWIPQHHLKKESTPAKKRTGGRQSTPGARSN